MLFFIVNEIGWQWVNIDDTREIKQMTVEKTQKKVIIMWTLPTTTFLYLPCGRFANTGSLEIHIFTEIYQWLIQGICCKGTLSYSSLSVDEQNFLIILLIIKVERWFWDMFLNDKQIINQKLWFIQQYFYYQGKYSKSLLYIVTIYVLASNSFSSKLNVY